MDAVDVVLPDYSLVLLTIERYSKLHLHIRRAWLGAHMRLTLVQAKLPGRLVVGLAVVV